MYFTKKEEAGDESVKSTKGENQRGNPYLADPAARRKGHGGLLPPMKVI